jgi:hypothetical protein
MCFDGRHDRQSQFVKSDTSPHMEQFSPQPGAPVGEAATEVLCQVPSGLLSRERFEWRVEVMLDAASNSLQQLMQLLYLLGRDPAVPEDARHHVTAAQAEIALLSRFMRNSAEERSVGEGQHPSAG